MKLLLPSTALANWNFNFCVPVNALLDRNIVSTQSTSPQGQANSGLYTMEHPLQGAHISVVGVHRLRCSVACGIPQTRDQSCVPCIGRWILNHCMSREVPGLNLSKELNLVSERKYSSAHKVNGGWRIFKNYSKGSPRMAGKSSHGKINETRSQTQN